MNRKMQVAALLGATMLGTSAWAQETDEIIVLSSPFKKAATESHFNDRNPDGRRH